MASNKGWQEAIVQHT
ncbi:Protein of unknown function [Bacillus thuringiensis]|uniref:Uncharacterized protein n=1 Tax=Bacillus thuringiensis TaxID=1428 RepID=A0A1C4F773_BACTU|nr:Protein of unknown function [Bacillus thuringiensis]